MNIKYRIVLYDPRNPTMNFLRSKIMTADAKGKAGVFARIQNSVAAASRGGDAFNFFHIEEEDGSDTYLGKEVFSMYVVRIEWL